MRGRAGEVFAPLVDAPQGVFANVKLYWSLGAARDWHGTRYGGDGGGCRGAAVEGHPWAGAQGQSTPRCSLNNQLDSMP